jgi:protein-disulfide isomerase
MVRDFKSFHGPMMLLSRRALLASPLLVSAPALAQEPWFPIRGADGREVQNHRVPIELETEFSELDHAFTIGSPDADVTLVEIYDSNCGFCRRAAADVKAMVAADPDLAVTFINAPSLGLPSVQAARVEYAVKQVGGADKVLAFHEASMAARGVFDGLRALETAKDLGLDDNQIEDLADKAETGRVLVQASRLANATNLAATPSWLVSGTAIIGWPGRPTLETVIRAIRQCDKPVCT